MVTDFLPLVKVVLQFLDGFRRKLRVNVLELKVVLAADDPCDLAVNYGRAWAAVGNLMPSLERVFVIQKRNIEVELHKKLAVSEKKYFDNAWDNKVKFLDYPNTYTLDINYHFIYLLDHAMHHMKKGGLGMKYPMDFYLYLNKYDVDFKFIKPILKDLKLEKFAKLIILLCNKWFNLSLDKYESFIGDFKLTDKELSVFEVFILSGGEYGLNRDIYTVQSVSQGNKLKYLLSKIFRPFRFVVKTDNPKWWQYVVFPYYYISYWFDYFILKGSKNIKKAKAYINSEDDIDLKDLFNKISK